MKNNYQITFDLQYDDQTTTLEIVNFSFGGDLLDKVDMKQIGELLSMVGKDCYEGKINLYGEQ